MKRNLFCKSTFNRGQKLITLSLLSFILSLAASILVASHDRRKLLFETAAIQLEVPLRSNQKEQKPVIRILKKVRKRIETVFSQLCDQFMIQRNYAKSFTGFKSRILAKVSGFTILQFLNKFIYNKPVGRVKHALAN